MIYVPIFSSQEPCISKLQLLAIDCRHISGCCFFGLYFACEMPSHYHSTIKQKEIIKKEIYMIQYMHNTYQNIKQY